jgi:hypothetical protein
MKTITKTFNLYTFDELSEKAKEKALKDWNDHYNGELFLEDNLREYVHEELKERGFSPVAISTSANPAIKVYYSLSYSQGDGLMFESDIKEEKTGNTYCISHAGHYYHERSANINGYDKDGEELPEKDITAFNESIYIPICKEVRDLGYKEIEYYQSEENFREMCDANEYTFLESGEMMNG